jgi:uncharacterized protein YdaU (DUF1376 family)
MGKDPAALFYIDTWISSTAEMDADTRGWYLNLILHQYDKGDLPDDVECLAQLAMVKFSEYQRWQQVWQQVLQHKFQKNDNGRLENPKVNEMLQKRGEFKSKRSLAGKISRISKVAGKLKTLQCNIETIKNYLRDNPEHEIFDHLDNQQVLQQKLKHLSQLLENGNEDGNEDGNGNRNGNGNTFLTEEELGQFKEIWLDYLQHRKELKVKQYGSRKSEHKGLTKLLEHSNKDPAKAQEIVDQSRANGWQGLFPLKESFKRSNPQVTLTEDQYMAMSAHKRSKYEHPLKLWGSDRKMKIVERPGEAPKPYQADE